MASLGTRGSGSNFGGALTSISSSTSTSGGSGQINSKFTDPLFADPATNEGLGMLKGALADASTDPFTSEQLEGIKARVSGSIEGGVQSAIGGLSASLGGNTSSAAFQLQKSRLRSAGASQAGQARADIDIQEQQMRLALEAQHRAELSNLAGIEQQVIRDSNAFSLGRAGIGVQQAQLGLQARQQSFAESTFADDIRLKQGALIGKYPALQDFLLGPGAGSEFFGTGAFGQLTTATAANSFNQQGIAGPR